MTEKCFACGKPLPKSKKMARVDLEPTIVYVGPDCYRHVVAGGEGGWQPPKGGPCLHATRQVSNTEADAYIAQMMATDSAADIE